MFMNNMKTDGNRFRFIEKKKMKRKNQIKSNQS
jgi:hypothetical protein